ncbi:MAG: YidC/Oxa1 family membrane protein insertase [Candidatus Colwellbacteria bacterium]
MREFFTEAFYRPLFNALAWLYENVAFEDLGIAIILLTLAVRILLFPLFHKTAKHQRVTQNLQPEIKRIQKKHKEDKETQAQKIMELYSQHKINPLTPLIALIIQLPVIIILYRIFIHGFSGDALNLLYPSIDLPDIPSQTFLGLVDLTKSNVWIIGFAAVAQYIQGRLALAKASKNKGEQMSKAEKVGKSMVIFMPILTVVILFTVPSAVGIYWCTTTLFSIGQQWLVNHSLNKEEQKRLLLNSNGEGKGQNSGDI